MLADIFQAKRYQYLGLAAVAGLSFGLRFWGLGRFDDLVFDEVYYARFAQAYLTGEAIFDAHPPLGKYAIASGIWLTSHLPWVQAGTPTNVLEITAISYRWMNALVGALVPLLVVGIAQSLAVKRQHSSTRFALLSGTFVATDGLFVTESRYALLNIYIVFFGLLGHWLWLQAESTGGKNRRRKLAYRLMSGIALGAAVATKWNGLGYLLSLTLWECWRTVDWQSINWQSINWRNLNWRNLNWQCASWRWRGIAQKIQWRSLRAVLEKVFCLWLLPFITYCLIWWPHLALSTRTFGALHLSLLTFHQGLESFQAACSRWFTWPLLVKPIAYWYVDEQSTVYTVNNLGNPALWWLSSAAVLAVLIAVVSRQRVIRRESTVQSRRKEGYGTDTLKAYLLIGYLANWLPWIVVGRCTYIYLFMPAAVFGFMLLAWLLSQWLALASPSLNRWLGFVMLCAIALSFFFWLPLSLGLPLTPEQLQLRWWLPSWI